MRVREAVSEILTKNVGEFFSGGQIAEMLGVSRNAVWKAIGELRENGYPIESRKHFGYRLVQNADLLTADTVREQLNCQTLGHNLYVFPSLSSTNDYCHDLYQSGAPHGTVVVANQQTAGRGQRGRPFESPAGSGIYFSFLLRHPIALEDAPLLTACTAVAAARAIDMLYDTHTQIKWVNDLILDGHKFGGILTEGGVSLETGTLDFVIIGIGINVRYTAENISDPLRERVTSIEESNPACHVHRAELLAAILYHFERLLPNMQTRHFLTEYRERSNLIGNDVALTDHRGHTRYGTVLDITDDCSLRVRNDKGKVETLHSTVNTVHLLNEHGEIIP